jgi:hypothetical protein
MGLGVGGKNTQAPGLVGPGPSPAHIARDLRDEIKILDLEWDYVCMLRLSLFLLDISLRLCFKVRLYENHVALQYPQPN